MRHLIGAFLSHKNKWRLKNILFTYGSVFFRYSKSYKNWVRVNNMKPTVWQIDEGVMSKIKNQKEQDLDFIVCGMPRGGTTYLGEMFNAHKDVYCYFMETSVFRQLFLFGRDRPFPKQNIPLLEQWLRAEFKAVLLDSTDPERVVTFRRLTKYKDILKEFGLDEVSGPGIRIVDKHDFECFLKEIVQLYQDGLHGKALFKAGGRVLSRYIRNVTERPILGEKTPDNLFYLENLYEANPKLQVFCVIREPLSTIESMKRRAENNHEVFDSVFSEDLLSSIAEYYKHIKIIYEGCQKFDPSVFHVIRYEDFIESPATIMEGIYGNLGIEQTQASIDIVNQLVMPTPKNHKRELNISAAESKLIDLILGKMLDYFGYDKGFFNELGLSVSASNNTLGMSEGIIPLSGLHLAAIEKLKEISWTWATRSVSLFLLFNKNRQFIRVSLVADYPMEINLEEVILILSSGEQEIGRYTINKGQQELQFSIDLAALPTKEADANILCADLQMTATVSYTPLTIPNMGGDMRDFSVLIRSLKLE